MATVYDFEAETLGGRLARLEEFKGKAMMIVNTASECGLTPQYRELEELYARYKDQGFVVLGFPCNQFGGQEPGTASEIGAFCERNFGVSFPMFNKIHVNGPDTHPLYVFLKQEAMDVDGVADIKWNFAKFLIGRDGKVYRRYAPQTRPFDVVGDIEKAIAVPAPD